MLVDTHWKPRNKVGKIKDAISMRKDQEYLWRPWLLPRTEVYGWERCKKTTSLESSTQGGPKVKHGDKKKGHSRHFSLVFIRTAKGCRPLWNGSMLTYSLSGISEQLKNKSIEKCSSIIWFFPNIWRYFKISVTVAFSNTLSVDTMVTEQGLWDLAGMTSCSAHVCTNWVHG